MRISRVKDVVIMMVLFNIWPEQIYRFSTRKLLPAKKNRFSKKIKPIIPFELLEDKSSNINNLFVSAGENVCWLLNIRGKDLPNSPVANCRLILNRT